MFAEGQGVSQDYAEALKWVTKAAEQGHAKAQYTLGNVYSKGQVIPQDDAQASPPPSVWLRVRRR